MFFFIDNGSEDHSLDLLVGEDVWVFATQDSYSSSNYGLDWTNAVASEFLVNSWVLTLDLDEQFVFPEYETSDIHALTARCEAAGADALLAFLLDMYGSGSLDEPDTIASERLIDVYPFFDSDSYDFDPEHPVYGRVPLRGGPRKRLFWSRGDLDYPPPFLPKIPLVRWSANREYRASTHVIDGVSPASAVTGALLHFKLLGDFSVRAAREALREQHFDGAKQYRAYWEPFRSGLSPSPLYGGSLRYLGSSQLVEIGLMHNEASAV